MNAKPVQERSHPVEGVPLEGVPRRPEAPTPLALRPASGLVLGLLLSAVFWLALLVLWLVV